MQDIQNHTNVGGYNNNPQNYTRKKKDTRMLAVAITIFVLEACYSLCVVAAEFNVTKTVPFSEDGGNPLVAAAENTSVVLFCEVIDASSGDNIRAQWMYLVPGQPSIILNFDANGTARPGSDGFMTSPNSDFRRNLTIIQFLSSYDETQLSCGVGGVIGVTYDLRVSSKQDHNELRGVAHGGWGSVRCNNYIIIQSLHCNCAS